MITMTNIIEESQEIFEAKVSVMKRGLGSKRAALAGGSAMTLARHKNPALFRMYQKHNLLRKQIKVKIMKQYGSQGRALARRKLK